MRTIQALLIAVVIAQQCTLPVPNTDPNAEVGDMCNESVCQISCQSGFTGGTAFFICSGGTWTGSLACEATPCASTIPLQSVSGAQSDCTSTGPLDNCTASCSSGYVGEDVTYFCGHESAWTPYGNPISCSPIDCGTAIASLDPNGIADCQGNTHFLGNPCVATCQTGYTGTDVTYMCGTDGLWAPHIGVAELSCSARSCGSSIVGLDEHGTATCVGDTSFGGDNCEADCKTGFQSADGNKTYECGASGLWEAVDSPLICSSVTCPSTIAGLDVNGQSVCPEGATFGNLCTAMCSPGFKSQQAHYYCGPEGAWLPATPALECVPLDCGTVIQTLPGNSEATCTGNTTFGGDNCFASCHPGYGSSTTDQVEYSCVVVTSGVAWEPLSTAIHCSPLPCDVEIVGLDENALSSCSAHAVFEDICEAHCKSGYHEATAEYACSNSQLWEPVTDALVCTPMDCGSTIAHLDTHGISNCESHLFGGENCVPTCVGGWVGNDAAYECVAGSHGVHWEAVASALVCQRLACDSTFTPSDANFAQPDCSSAHLYQDDCTVSCAPGYDGSATYSCNASGEWTSSSELVCTPVECPVHIPNLIHATATCAMNEYGSSACTAECLPGYLPATADYFCTSEGSWDAVSDGIVCVPLDCGTTVTSLASDPVVMNCAGDTKYGGDFCHVECASGYHSNSTTYTCGAQGEWIGGVISCEPKDCGPLIYNLDIHATAVCEGTTTFGGDSCVATCKVGYEESYSNYVCSPSGIWEPETTDIICLPKDCGSKILDSDPNAKSNCRETSFGSHCTARCPLGYKGGDRSYECTGAGWSPVDSAISCTLRDCGSTIPNLHSKAQANCTGNTMYGGDNCVAQCLPGYSGQDIMYECTAEGNWVPNNDSAIVCSTVECPPAPVDIDAHATYICSSELCSVYCQPGYQSGTNIGTLRYSCNAAGKWEIVGADLKPSKNTSFGNDTFINATTFEPEQKSIDTTDLLRCDKVEEEMRTAGSKADLTWVYVTMGASALFCCIWMYCAFLWIKKRTEREDEEDMEEHFIKDDASEKIYMDPIGLVPQQRKVDL